MGQARTTTIGAPAAGALRIPALPAAAGARPRSAVVAGVGLLSAVAFALLLRDPLLSGDMVYHLIWGRELAHGTLESFIPGPTPHPLVLALAAATSVLGTQASYDVTWLLFGPVALGAAIAALYCLGSQVGTRWTAVLAAATLAVDDRVLTWTAVGQYDIAFGALVLWALAAHLARPARPLPVLVLLGLAGLIRPEAWLIAGLYWLWAARAMPWRLRFVTAGVVGFAPLCWMAMDAAVTGDFLYSLHYTESASQALTSRYTTGEHLGESLADLARVTGVLTLPAALLLLLRRTEQRPGLRPVLALLGLTLGIYALLLLDGMPNERYLIVPAWLLILLAAAAATPGRAGRSPVALVAATLMALQLLVYWQQPLESRDISRTNVSSVTALREALERPGVRAAIASCPSVTATAYSQQLWAYWSGRSPRTIATDDRPATRPDVFVAPASERDARWLLKRKDFDGDAAFAVPAGMRAGPVAGPWRLYLNPASPCTSGI